MSSQLRELYLCGLGSEPRLEELAKAMQQLEGD
jgi:hypothetical protein